MRGSFRSRGLSAFSVILPSSKSSVPSDLDWHYHLRVHTLPNSHELHKIDPTECFQPGRYD